MQRASLTPFWFLQSCNFHISYLFSGKSRLVYLHSRKIKLISSDKFSRNILQLAKRFRNFSITPRGKLRTRQVEVESINLLVLSRKICLFDGNGFNLFAFSIPARNSIFFVWSLKDFSVRSRDFHGMNYVFIIQFDIQVGKIWIDLKTFWVRFDVLFTNSRHPNNSVNN